MTYLSHVGLHDTGTAPDSLEFTYFPPIYCKQFTELVLLKIASQPFLMQVFSCGLIFHM